MAITIKHAKTDNIADWTQADLDAQIAAGNYPPGTVLADIVLPSDWNNNHTVTGLGTMATQDANAVAITGGTVNDTSQSHTTITNYESFTPTTAPSYAEGRVWYDSTEKALAFYNDSSALAVHVGQDLIVKVINNTGSTIANGSPVYITGTSSGQTYPNVALAKADVAATSSIIGLTNGAIANGAIGYVTSQGTIDNVNTSTYTVGQVLYLSPYSAGQLMNTIPPTGITVQVGVVTFVDSTTGHIYVKQTTPLAVPASIITGILPVANGGTGLSSLTANYIPYGNGTSAFQSSANFTFNGTTVTTANDASISGLTVGKGGGAVASNTAIGYQSLFSTSTGTNKTALGYQAGYTSIVANNTTYVGYQAGYLSTGTNVTAIGSGAMAASGNGQNIVAVGYLALNANTTGTENTAIGSGSLQVNTTGNGNVAVGQATLQANTTGGSNTALGRLALLSNVTGQFNTAVGHSALLNSGKSVTAGSFVVGVSYTIISIGTTDFTLIGAASNTVGLTFTATGVGTGTGTACSNSNSNTAIGYQALTTNTVGTGITAVGYQSGYAHTSGIQNTFVGYQSGYTNTAGSYNTALGHLSLYTITAGAANTGIGVNALSNTNTTYYNTALGTGAGQAVTSGGSNTLLGTYAGYSGTNNLTTGSNNTIIGYNAAASSATVSNEITLGNASVTSLRVPGIAATFGTDNSTISTLTVGKGAGAVATNTAVGFQSLFTNSTGLQSVAVGYQALYFATGSYNTAIGYQACKATTTGIALVGIGTNSLVGNTTGSNNVGIGVSSLALNTTGSSNTATGTYSLNYNTIGSNNTALGSETLTNNTSAVATLGTITGGTGYTNGTYTGVVMTLSSGSAAGVYPTATIVVSGGAVTSVTLTAFGSRFINTTTVLTAPAASIGGTGSGFTVPVATLATGGNNTAVGYQALNANTTASSNAAFGYQALLANTTGSQNTAVGFSSLPANTTGVNNTALGFRSLFVNTTGQENTALGLNTLYSNTTGNLNTAVGEYALVSNISGSNNTALGFSAGYSLTGANNTLLGYQAGNSGTNNLTTGSNNIIIGYNAAASSATVSNEVTIGNDSITSTRLKGNVAIGLTTATEKLQVAGGASIDGDIVASNTGGRVSLGVMGASYNNDVRAFVGWRNTGSPFSGLAGSLILQARSSAASDIIFVTGSTTATERMKVFSSGGVSIGNTTDPGLGNLSVTGTVRTQGYTVATLPAAGTIGRRAYVTDALAPTYLGALVGGGAINCPVFDNGTAWVSA